MNNKRSYTACVLGVVFGALAVHSSATGAQPSAPSFRFALAISASPARAACDPLETAISGSTSQGGYSFEYESWRGTNCRVYRLCNKTGRELTPVLWRDKNEVFIDASLPRCATGSTCACIEVIKPTRQTFQSRTSLTYGINKDEYKEAPPAYSDPEHQATASDQAYPLYIVLRGTVADAEGKPVRLGLGLASVVSPQRDKLIYQMTAARESRNFDLVEKYPTRINDLTLQWWGAKSQAFDRILTGKKATVLTANDKSIVVDIALRSKFALESELMTVSSAGKPIFATTAPAYRPIEGWNPER